MCFFYMAHWQMFLWNRNLYRIRVNGYLLRLIIFNDFDLCDFGASCN